MIKQPHSSTCWLTMRDYGRVIGREGKVLPEQCRDEVIRGLREDPEQVMFVWELSDGVYYDVTEEFFHAAGLEFDPPLVPTPLPPIDSSDVRKHDSREIA